MARLCKLFNISYNELLSGEEISQKDYKQQRDCNKDNPNLNSDRFDEKIQKGCIGNGSPLIPVRHCSTSV